SSYTDTAPIQSDPTNDILRPFQSPYATVVLIEFFLFISSGSKSVVVEPSSTLPRRVTAPAVKSRASTRDVLPTPPCPTTPTLRTFPISSAIDRYLPAGLPRCGNPTTGLYGRMTRLTCARSSSSLPARSTGEGSGGGSYLRPAPVKIIVTSVSRTTSPRPFSTRSAATRAADSGAVQIPSSRATSRCASWMAVSLTATAPPPVSRSTRSIWRPANGDGTRSPAAWVVGSSQ